MGWFLLFAMFSVIFGAATLVWWNIENEKQRQRLVRNLTSNVNPEATVRTTVLVEKPGRGAGIAAMFKAGRTPGRIGRVDRLSKTRFLLLNVFAGVLGFFFGLRFVDMIGFLAPVIGLFAGVAVPRMYRAKFRDKRIAAIEEQFPEALDFLSRSVRAGNAFSIALELLAAEAPEPLKSEIVKATREMALGASLEDALHGLIARIPLLEIRMFVAAVLLQRETGGNLSEVLGKLAISVRERLRLRGQIQAASGQGRMTALVLTFLPAATLLMLKIASPSYMSSLTSDPVGRNLLGVAIVSQILGYMVMQRMLKVEA